MKNLPETLEIPTEPIVEYVLFWAHEDGEWQTPSIGDHRDGGFQAADTDCFRDGVTARNVNDVEIYDDHLVLYGKFTVAEVVDYLPQTWHHPAEISTETRDAFFTVSFEWIEYPEVVVEVEVV